MPRGDGDTPTVWLTVKEFSTRQRKRRHTIYKWIRGGFITELGYIIRHQPGGDILIGIPPQHSSYSDFASGLR